MATAKKSQPLTLEELLSAQYQMLNDPKLTESQRSAAEQQIEKLEQIQKSLAGENSATSEITKVKGSGQNVSLGDVRKELQGLRKDLTTRGTAPAQDRQPLPQLRLVKGGADDSQLTQQPDAESQTEREARLRKIGSIIEQKTEVAKGGSRNETLNSRNAQTFERFIAESGKKEELLADADERQLEIFKRIEDTMIKLREAGSEESDALRKELAGISGELEQTGNTKAKEKLTPMLANVRSTARAGISGRNGNLGDVFGALSGKREVLKEGTQRDARTGRVHDINPDGTQGKMTKGGAAAARMGRLGGAATIMKSFVGNKIEQFYENQRSPAVQGFLDRNIRSESSGEQVAALQGQQDVLVKGKENKETAQPVPQRTKPELKVVQGGVAAAAQASGNSLKAQVINITGNVVNIRGGKAAASTPTAAPNSYSTGAEFSGSGSAAGTKKNAAPGQATAEPKEEGGGILDTALELGGGLFKGGAGLLTKGAGMIKGAGGVLKAAGPGLLKGGVAALGGAALSYGGDKLKEAGYEKTGAAADVGGQALQWGGTGAMIGSVIPGVGTAIGAGVGALAGGAYGLYKNRDTIFGGKKSENVQATATPATSMGSAKTAEKQPEQPKKKEAGPNYKARLKDYETSTPVDKYESTTPGIKKKFLELAKAELPSTDNMQSLQSHEEKLAYKAQQIMEGKGQEKPTKAEGKPEAKPADSTKATQEDWDLAEAEFDTDKEGMDQDLAEPTAKPKSRPPSKAEKLRETARKMGIDPNKAEGQFEGGVLTKIKDTGTGTEHKVEVSEGDQRNVNAARQMRAMNENSGRLAAEAGKKHNIGELSRDNKENAQKPGAPVIINNNSSTGGNTAAPPASMPRGGVRPSESAMEKYANRTSHFW